MTVYKAQIRNKNPNVLHIFDMESDGTRPACGTRGIHFQDYRATFPVTEGDIDREYLIRDGDVKGKLCGNCLGVITGDLF